VHLSSTFYT